MKIPKFAKENNPNMNYYYDDEAADLRFEASQVRQDEEEYHLRLRAGCTEECEDCSCIQDMLEREQDLKDLNADFYNSRGVF